MNAPKDTRPFDLEAARAGAPYACRNGKKAEILKWDAKGGDCPIVGLVGDEIQDIRRWSTDGETAAAFDAGFALVMTPLGYIEGKPVFVGDEIELKCLPAPLQWKRVKAEPTWAGTWTDECARWPAPAKVYPETQMTGKELWNVYFKNDGNSEGSYVAVANAALRHAIDSGQLPTKEAYDQLRADLLEAEQRNAARDMAVAEAVRSACKFCIGGATMDAIDLAAIIDNVPVSA